MWRTVLILSLVSYSLAIPAPQEDAKKSTIDGIKDLFESKTRVLGKPSNVNRAAVFSTTKVTINITPLREPVGCECVHYYRCHTTKDEDFSINIKLDQSLANISPSSKTARDEDCPHYLDVCCKPSDVSSTTIEPPPEEEEEGCGLRNPNGIGFKITGQTDEAEYGEFPWMVAIMLKQRQFGDDKDIYTYRCGGSLIHKQAVLTAAHCVSAEQPETIRIRAGEWDSQTDSEYYPYQERDVKTVLVHEDYNAKEFYNDFAILILDEPVHIEENVKLICLPDKTTVFDRFRCVASGWGQDTYGEYQAIMKKIDLPIVPNGICQNTLRVTELGGEFELHESFICAGGESVKDTCKGDGGSPLVCPSTDNPNVYFQAGIVSWGISCGEDGTPGLYSNVMYARDWIDEQLASIDKESIHKIVKQSQHD